MAPSARRKLEYIAIDDLPEDPANPKGHDAEGIRSSIATLGYIEPIVLDERTGQIISGHGRKQDLIAARDAGADLPDGIIVKAGKWCAPVVRGWASKDDTHKNVALVALNRLVERGGWQADPLVQILTSLDGVPMPEFDGNPLDLTGFVNDDLEQLRASLEPKPDHTSPENSGPPLEAPERVKRGELWRIGDQLLLCGDCRDLDDVDRLLEGVTLALAVTSPPYAEQRDYDDESGFAPVPPDMYVKWFELVQAGVAKHLAEDGSWLVNIKPPGTDLDTDLYVFDLVAAHVREWGWHWATEFCWERLGVPKAPIQRLKNGFEPVYQFAKARWKFRPEHVRYLSENVPVSLGPGSGDTSWKDRQGIGGVIDPARRPKKHAHPSRSGGVGESDQGSGWTAIGDGAHYGWAFPNNRLPTFSGTHDATGHPAAFPVGLPQFFVQLFTDEGDAVYDPFAGSGSTLLAAQNTGRRGFGIELSPRYCDIILARCERDLPGIEISMVAPA
jgi:hypothetical protein